MDLIDALQARRGLVCLVGAGGKKTAMRRLAEAHDGPVALTSLTRIPPFATALDACLVIDQGAALEESVVAAARETRIVAYAGPLGPRHRHEGVPEAAIRDLHEAAGFVATYIKADGARMRLVKGPLEGEPELSAAPAAVIAVASVRAVGRPLDEHVAHRPGRLAEIAGATPGAPIEPGHLASLVVHQHRDLVRRTGAPVTPLLNMADDPGLEATAREVAALARAAPDGPPRVVIACLLASRPLVGIV